MELLTNTSIAKGARSVISCFDETFRLIDSENLKGIVVGYTNYAESTLEKMFTTTQLPTSTNAPNLDQYYVSDFPINTDGFCKEGNAKPFSYNEGLAAASDKIMSLIGHNEKIKVHFPNFRDFESLQYMAWAHETVITEKGSFYLFASNPLSRYISSQSPDISMDGKKLETGYVYVAFSLTT